MELEKHKKEVIEKMLMSDDQRNVRIAKCMLRAAGYSECEIDEWKSNLLPDKFFKRLGYGGTYFESQRNSMIYLGTSGMEIYNSMMKKLWLEQGDTIKPSEAKGYFLPAQFTKAQWTEDD